MKHIGEWRNGEPRGLGVRIYSSKSKQKKAAGEFHGDMFSGLGVSHRRNGQKSAGEYDRGMKHGLCTHIANGDKEAGEYDRGKLKGLAVREFPSARRCRWAGTVDNGKFNGLGTVVYQSGDQYVGSYKNSNKHGYGVYVFANGTRHKTTKWKNNKPA